AIPGVSHSTVRSIMSEMGPEGFSKFPTAQHVASWLRLAPNNKISGGKPYPIGYHKVVIDLR
ncbi:MAG: transposase, partial [Bacteroidota bacterium]